MDGRSYNDKKATYEYDEADNLIKEVSEYGLTETYQYDDFGQMGSRIVCKILHRQIRHR